MQDHSLPPPATVPMLRSIPQLRLSSEIELFADRIDPLVGTSGIPGLYCFDSWNQTFQKLGFFKILSFLRKLFSEHPGPHLFEPSSLHVYLPDAEPAASEYEKIKKNITKHKNPMLRHSHLESIQNNFRKCKFSFF